MSVFLVDQALVEGKPWEFSILECADCGFGQQDPRPTPAVLASIYTNEYPVFQDDSGEVASVQRRIKMKVADWSRHAGMRGTLAKVVEHAGSRSVPLTTSVAFELGVHASILDFGCGGGWWIRSLAHAGFKQLAAYDVDHPGLPRVERDGITVYRGADFLPERAFDMIRLEHVFEHLADPVAELQRLSKSLRPGGRLVLTVPNFGSWSRNVLGTEWGAILVPQHCNHFTSASLRSVAQQAGLVVTREANLPIWELALPALQREPGFANRLLKLGMSRLARQAYFERAKRKNDGEFLGVELMQRSA